MRSLILKGKKADNSLAGIIRYEPCMSPCYGFYRPPLFFQQPVYCILFQSILIYTNLFDDKFYKPYMYIEIIKERCGKAMILMLGRCGLFFSFASRLTVNMLLYFITFTSIWNNWPRKNKWDNWVNI